MPAAALPSVIGLIAGNGRFPLMFAAAARARGVRVVTAAVRGDASWLVRFVSDDIFWFSLKDFSRACAFFRDHGARDVLMAGQVHPDTLFAGTLDADPSLAAFFRAMQDRQCDTIFSAVASLLAKEGLHLLDSTLLLRDHLAPRGTLTRRAPTAAELTDIELGMKAAKHSGAMDIGQTVVVRDRAIVAVEALEGTDRCILRGGAIARRGAVVVKMSKPAQDNRFDVPVVGPRTIDTMKRVRAACLAIEAGRTLIIDREKTVAMADRAGICIVAAGQEGKGETA